MAGMPAKYREVLRLSLFHDLSSTEIAQALERPRETVKSQVRRGLLMLQKAMPQSLALGALVTMLPGRGLAAMKLQVLAAAGLGVRQHQLAGPDKDSHDRDIHLHAHSDRSTLESMATP